MSMINYGNPTITTWEVDSFGNKVSVPRLGEQKQVIGDKFTLEGLPDEQQRVSINGYTEIDINQPITSPTQFKVDYKKTGNVFMHPSKDGQTITVTKYSSRGMIFMPASRIWTKVDLLA